jgi:hypothetical protein
MCAGDVGCFSKRRICGILAVIGNTIIDFRGIHFFFKY